MFAYIFPTQPNLTLPKPLHDSALCEVGQGGGLGPKLALYFCGKMFISLLCETTFGKLNFNFITSFVHEACSVCNKLQQFLLLIVCRNVIVSLFMSKQRCSLHFIFKIFRNHTVVSNGTSSMLEF